MPCMDYSFAVTLKALYEILIVASLSYTAQVLHILHIFSIIMLFILLSINHIKNVSSESFWRFP